MKVNSTFFDSIQVEGKCAVMTGEDTDVKAIQFRGSDETLAGSFHKNHVRIADDRTPEPRRGRQNTKRDERITRMVPRIVVAEQWLCFLLGLICMICGVCGLFMKYNQDSPFCVIADGWDLHMDRYYDSPQLHASSRARFWFVADWQARTNRWSLSIKSRCDQFAQT
jgi:hypothetical protein